MVYEQGIPDFNAWLYDGLFWFALMSAIGILAGLFFGYLSAASQHGPAEGVNRVTRTLRSAFTEDFPGFSLRRTYAIAWLAVQESLRRRVLVSTFALFAAIMLFAGWFLDSESDHPARLYLSFVLPTSSMLVVVLSIFLSTLSLPNDIKNRTIYTVVTKPVRSLEIVVGRMAGFIGMGTFLLAVMALLSYIFVVRGVSHSHTIDADSITERTSSGKVIGYEGRTSKSGPHQHAFEVVIGKEQTEGRASYEKGHRHTVVRKDDATFEIGPPEGQLEAKVPLYGKLSWTDRNGRVVDTGIDVGDEWSYRKNIAGGTKASAIWKFKNLKKEDFPNGIPLEFNIAVFRTYKGDIAKTVLGSISLRNPGAGTQRQSAPFFFRPKEFELNEMTLPLKVKRLPDAEQLRGGRDAKTLGDFDLFEDLVHNGELEVIMQCAEPGQYYGVAEPDVYIRAADLPFWGNFLKCFLTIWLSMAIVVSFGVMYSTFLSGPVAFLATLCTIGVGYFSRFVRDIFEGTIDPENPMLYKGGGPIESFIRISTQQNIQTDLEMGAIGKMIVQSIDMVFIFGMYGGSYLVPNFNDFDTVNYVAYGYDINVAIVATLVLKALAYTAGTTLVAYFTLKTREIAA